MELIKVPSYKLTKNIANDFLRVKTLRNFVSSDNKTEPIATRPHDANQIIKIPRGPCNSQ